MKRNINIFTTLIVFSMLIIGSCTKSYNDQNREEYDYSAIFPKIMGLAGPTSVAAAGASYQYVIDGIRGGSTYTWQIVAGASTGTITVDSEFSYKASLNIPQSGSPENITLKVIETTMGGIASVPFEKTITVTPFCPFNIANFTGDFDCDETGYGVYGVTITAAPGEPNTIIIDNFWDYSGQLKVTFSNDAFQKLTVAQQTLNMGGDDYVTTGSGTYDGCAGTFKLNTDVGGSATVQSYSKSTAKKRAEIVAKRGTK